ncbi:granzyme K-like [Scyliorhinus canicula]|uniref:granzyme K-like n=1 Tax=Scyliorhinus canicula TaxID=7830 RepID=UPI0018F7CB29|nr:granzyme K-like [Scyliorhinus canicula]
MGFSTSEMSEALNGVEREVEESVLILSDVVAPTCEHNELSMAKIMNAIENLGQQNAQCLLEMCSDLHSNTGAMDHGVEIIGGHVVKPHSKSYMASFHIFNNKKNSYVHNCRGALIGRRWLLTAAHCKSKGSIRVVLEAHSLSRNEKSQQKLPVKEQHPHPDFNKENSRKLHYAAHAKINKYVKQLKLPKAKRADAIPGTRCTVAGWGAAEPASKSPSDTLEEVDLTFIDRETCNRSYHGNPKITENMICAGDSNGSKDANAGDSGGPLICKGVYVQRDCGIPTAEQPGIYTLVSKKYLD